MTSIEQANRDLAVGDKYVDNIEKTIGKKATPSLRRMLRDAVMAGIKHGRETVDAPEMDRLGQLLKKSRLF